MKRSTTAQRLKQLMTERGMRQIDILEATTPYAGAVGVKMNKSDISQYVSGKAEPGQDKLMVLSQALGVDPAWLMGYDAPSTLPGVLPTTVFRVPLMGTIACGEPILAEADIDAFAVVGSAIECDFALRCQGDSMINARIYDGDIVFIKQQEYVDDGTVAAVLLDDEATLKRVYKLADGRVELRAENPRYKSIIVGGEDETRTFRILGKAVAFQSTVI